ncbi:NAD(P)H-binding protein [Paenibacillus albicereus]|uniref:NAD(P)H-binding protein n=1 Tax=Paenibacillus albicereus TaxID=2726185 RepID=A0A6H2GXM8_9BACL|nr:NAD(P)H-binding protein [Paenibacillus albicereus]QJC52109.1 NAD(P)H-binding protein [Paenibacillus albicereus]
MTTAEQTGLQASRSRPVVALTGASGYIGRHLLEKLRPDFSLIALSRQADPSRSEPGVEWRRGDFFSQEQAAEALRGADVAIYLIHSMMPSAKLTQGSFEDMDAILAVHFARAAAGCGVRQIVYLSGMIPPDVPPEKLSRHLRSRLEVERILGSYGVPVTTIRAGLIVGPEGSSFPILSKLVRRLPVMILPSWTRTPTHPIALSDILNSITAAIGKPEAMGRAVDAGGPDRMSYQDLLRETAAVMGLRRWMIPFPFPTVKLSRLWISLVAGAPKEIAYPLVESLAHPMVSQRRHEIAGLSDGRISYREAAADALRQEEELKRQKGKGAGKSGASRKPAAKADVRSVQRFRLQPGQDAHWAGEHYLTWLGSAFQPLIRAERGERGEVSMRLFPLRRPLLELRHAEARSTPHRSTYRIAGGRFAHAEEGDDGRLEFLQLPESRDCLAAIHDYRPALPWFLYKYGQAKAHLLVMRLFGRHLRALARKRPEEAE